MVVVVDDIVVVVTMPAFSFRKKREEELMLHVGDEVTLLEDGEEGWWKGEARGKVGFFPSYKVEARGANKYAHLTFEAFKKSDSNIFYYQIHQCTLSFLSVLKSLSRFAESLSP